MGAVLGWWALFWALEGPWAQGGLLVASLSVSGLVEAFWGLAGPLALALSGGQALSGWCQTRCRCGVRSVSGGIGIR